MDGVTEPPAAADAHQNSFQTPNATSTSLNASCLTGTKPENNAHTRNVIHTNAHMHSKTRILYIIYFIDAMACLVVVYPVQTLCSLILSLGLGCIFHMPPSQ